ncbi:response regulator containing a CheY-like receiver domain and an HTH DNA-binding domain [Leptolyngbyaceae cyanobacterium JSC-12]|nr:response regulator containing a CheY-like receiver domain and an HTH DNA-binding domain [Leptolyngbyaceae cyanobacterium JSC-12]
MRVQPNAIATTPLGTNNDALLQTIIESLVDGILLVTVQGRWVYGNYNAQRICQQLNSGKFISDYVPTAIRRVCQTFLHYCSQRSPNAQLEAETAFNQVHYRVRVRWFQPEEQNLSLLLVTLEDCNQAARNRAIAEVQQFNLTERQADVWLLYRAGYTYQEIATQLFVTINTVKRHMKNIYAKQRSRNGQQY